MSPERLVLLDTTVVLHIARGGRRGEAVRRQALRQARTSLISVVSLGEGAALARHLGWGARRIEVLRQLLSDLIVVDLHHGPVLEGYAEIYSFLRRSGKLIGQNDMWIAACAGAASASLATTDRDFDRLDERFVSVERIDPAGGAAPDAPL